jgi:hypothetical protein
MEMDNQPAAPIFLSRNNSAKRKRAIARNGRTNLKIMLLFPLSPLLLFFREEKLFDKFFLFKKIRKDFVVIDDERGEDKV